MPNYRYIWSKADSEQVRIQLPDVAPDGDAPMIVCAEVQLSRRDRPEWTSVKP
jgi:hypothetical protein